MYIYILYYIILYYIIYIYIPANISTSIRRRSDVENETKSDVSSTLVKAISKPVGLVISNKNLIRQVISK